MKRTSRTARRAEAQLAFEALSIEGGLLAPEWLARVAQLAAPAQTDADYRIDKGLNLRDEIGRFWRLAHALWKDLADGRDAKADPRALADRVLVPMLKRAFGFESLVMAEPLPLGAGGSPPPATPPAPSARPFPVSHFGVSGKVPVVIAPAGIGLDTPSPAFGEGGRRRSAFGLAQEYLNATDGALWGLVTDGLTLRVLRDNASLTRPAWIEADLARIFTEERYADFAALWLLVHESRFGRPDQPPVDCALEVWRNAGREEGTRAREHLRKGVEDAVLALGQGFLANPANTALRADLESGTLTRDAYRHQLLRLVYRLIFLLTVEEREILHPPGTPDAARKLYAGGYSLRRLRERAVRRSAHDRNVDLWEAVKIVLSGVATGEPRLGLPALAGLFAADQAPALDSSKLENRALLVAMFKLCWLKEQSGLSRVNWRDMGPEELGSVYESLLELVPVVSLSTRTFSFATAGETKGNARKTTGSYYTPDSLVQVLLDSALEPVVRDTIAANPANPARALLKLTIVDPACGSGHFLLSAARRLAAHVARLEANGTPSAAEYRKALRKVVGSCIYGVDLNPMAVELCKVALWMEAVEPGLPLTFLDAHIRHGNALLGATPDLIAKGIPDDAWNPIEGDDKQVAKELKKRHKAGNTPLFGPGAGALVDAPAAAFEAEDDGTLDGLSRKERRYREWLAESQDARLIADVWCAAFVWPKQPGEAEQAAPVKALWKAIRENPRAIPDATRRITRELVEQYRFFHWHVEFPEVFHPERGRGGFDVVLGNPPWERVTLKEKEWFSTRDEHVANAPTNAERQVRIQSLAGTNPALLEEYLRGKRLAAGEKVLLRTAGRYPLCGQGDVNTFAVFGELGVQLNRGRSGMVLPTGIATADTTQDFIASLVLKERLVSLFDFDNRAGIFPAVQGNVRFCLLCTSGKPSNKFLVAAQLRDTRELHDPTRVWSFRAEDVRRINPNTLTLPLFPTTRDAQLARTTYERARCLEEQGATQPSGWTAPMQRMLHMGDDSGHFRTEPQLESQGFTREGCCWHRGGQAYVPLLEAKFCHQFDHRDGTFEGIAWEDRFGTHPATRAMSLSEHQDPHSAPLPRYWVPKEEVTRRIGGRAYLLGFRDAVSAVADTRSLVASVVPAHGAGDTLKFVFAESAREASLLCAWMNSYVTDFIFRLKASGAHASFFLVKQLPIPERMRLARPAPWDTAHSAEDWLVERVLELTYTAWDLEPFAKELGYSAPPFVWEPARREILRAEIDAAFFMLAGLGVADAEYILDCFPAQKRAEEREFQEFRSKRLILEVFDALSEAARTGVSYVTRLNPPPADPRVAHPPRPTPPE